MAEYRLVSLADSRGQKGAILHEGHIFQTVDLIGSDCTVLELLRNWDESRARISSALAQVDLSAVPSIPLEEAKLGAPVQYPGAFFCAGSNYWDHLDEMTELVKQTTGATPTFKKGPEPWFFVKTTRGSIVGTGACIRIPPFTTMLDWEAELGVVIGREASNIPEADALSIVAGYLAINDLSARNLIKREDSPFIYDFLGQKCFDGSAPMGPWLTPAEFVADPQNLDIALTVNGVVKQSSNTSRMVYSIAEQVAYLSRHITLFPGDVIATGTPAGVGMPKKEFLLAGDEVAIEIEGLGRLVNIMKA